MAARREAAGAPRLLAGVARLRRNSSFDANVALLRNSWSFAARVDWFRCADSITASTEDARRMRMPPQLPPPSTLRHSTSARRSSWGCLRRGSGARTWLPLFVASGHRLRSRRHANAVSAICLCSLLTRASRMRPQQCCGACGSRGGCGTARSMSHRWAQAVSHGYTECAVTVSVRTGWPSRSSGGCRSRHPWTPGGSWPTFCLSTSWWLPGTVSYAASFRSRHSSICRMCLTGVRALGVPHPFGGQSGWCVLVRIRPARHGCACCSPGPACPNLLSMPR